MHRKMWTVFTGNKYPKWFPAMLARSLQPYKVELCCLTDNPTLPVEKNLTYILVDLPASWWGKMVFFNEKFTSQALVIDVDSLFIADPEPIFTWLENRRPPLAFITEPMRTKGTGTSMFYVDHAYPLAGRAWEVYNSTKRPNIRADQDFLNTVYTPTDWVQLPRHFQIQYKCISRHSKTWIDIGERVYGSLEPERFISVHFNGKPWPHEVVQGKSPHWELFKPYIPEGV